MIISFMLLLYTQIQICVNTSFVQFVLFGSARTKTLPTLLEVYFLTSIRRSALDPQICLGSVDLPWIRRSALDPQIRRCSRRSVQFVFSLFLSLFLSFLLFYSIQFLSYLVSIQFVFSFYLDRKKAPFRGLGFMVVGNLIRSPRKERLVRSYR